MAQDAKPNWRGMDAATRAKAYSPSSVLAQGDLTPFIQRYIERSAQVYDANDVQTLVYGGQPANTIDIILPAVRDAPLHAFVHGGYWQELSKCESMFPATDTLAHNMGFAAIDYTLAPNASLDEIIKECCAAISCLFENAALLGFDRDRIVLSGSSAGAHLAAMACLRLPQSYRPKGVILMSGIYELEPLIGTYINAPLGLNVETAKRNSPVLADLSNFPPSVIAWGAIETDEFKRQSRMFHDRLRRAGARSEMLEVDGRNHFDIVEEIASDSTLGRALATLAET